MEKTYTPRFANTKETAPYNGVVVDLSRFANNLADYEDISSFLTEEEEAKIVAYVKAMAEMSHSRISRR